MAATVTTLRQATPERWRKALDRAISGGVQIRQLAGSGAWVATSASDPAAAYEVAVADGVAHGCSCRAGEFGDAVCRHRAAWYHAAGLLDPEPQPPAPAASAALPCFECKGSGREWVEAASGEWFRVACIGCEGTGEAGEEGDDDFDGDEGWESAPYDWWPAA